MGLRNNFFSPQRLGKSFARSTSRQMISSGKGADNVGQGLMKAGGLVGSVGTVTANPYLMSVGGAMAASGGALSLSGKILKSSGRIGRNTIVRGESLGEQKKHVGEFTKSSKEGIQYYTNAKY